MASYEPPQENLPIFDPSVFNVADEALSYNEASKYFLKYPIAQGTETLQATNINGALQVNSSATFTNTITGTIQKANNITAGTAGDILYQSASNTTAKLPIGTNTYVLTSNGTAPTWTAPFVPTTPTLANVLVSGNSAGSNGINMNSQDITNATAITATTFNGALNGNASSATTANTATNISGGVNGDLLYQNGVSTTTKLPIGTNTYVLTSNGTAPVWSAPVVPTLSQVLVSGNSAGTQDINMNGNDINGGYNVNGVFYNLTDLTTTATDGSIYANGGNFNYDNNINSGSHNFAVNDAGGVQRIPLNLTSSQISCGAPINLNSNNITNGGTITATFNGALNGTATNATNAVIGLTNLGINQVVPLINTATATAGNYPLSMATTYNNNILFNNVSGMLTCNGITSTLTGNASSATTATTATNVNLSNIATGNPYYLIMSATQSGSSALLTDNSGASYDSGTNTITANINGNSATATTATTATNVAGGANGSLVYQTGSSATTTLPIGTNNQVLVSNGTIPVWTTPAVVATPNLSAVLTAGNSAGSTDINMNGNDITGSYLINNVFYELKDLTTLATDGSIYANSGVFNYDNNINSGTHNFAVNDAGGVQKIPLTLSSTGLQVGTGLGLDMGTGSITNASAMTATTFNGTLSGNATTATTATKVALTTDNNSGSFYIPFAKALSTSEALYVDNATGPLTYNPSTSNLTATTFTGALNGNANTATSATTATTATNANNVNISNTASGATNYVLLSTSISGNAPVLTDTSGLSYNSTTNTLVANISGSAGSAPMPFVPKYHSFANYQTGTTGYSQGAYINWSSGWGALDYVIVRVRAQVNWTITAGEYNSYATSAGELIIRPFYAPAGVIGSLSTPNIFWSTNSGSGGITGVVKELIYYTGAVNNGTQSYFFVYGNGGSGGGSSGYIQLMCDAPGTAGGWQYTCSYEYMLHTTSGASITFSNGVGTNNSLP